MLLYFVMRFVGAGFEFGLRDIRQEEVLEKKVQILHRWSEQDLVGRVIRELSGAGIELEMHLVRSSREFASALLRKNFDLIIVDPDGVSEPNPDDLSFFEIAQELAPHIPFLLIPAPEAVAKMAASSETLHSVSKNALHLLGPLARKALLASSSTK